MPIGSTQVPDPNGKAWFAPNLFKFTLAKDNTIYPTSTISEPYDVTIVWPAADYFGERDISCVESWFWTGQPPEPNLAWCWSPLFLEANWEKHDVIMLRTGIVMIEESATVPQAGTPAPRFNTPTEAENYAVTLNMPSSYHNCGDYYCPGGNYDEWAAMAGIPNNIEMNVFGVSKSDYHNKLVASMCF